jgi:hypothetical protein
MASSAAGQLNRTLGCTICHVHPPNQGWNSPGSRRATRLTLNWQTEEKINRTGYQHLGTGRRTSLTLANGGSLNYRPLPAPCNFIARLPTRGLQCSIPVAGPVPYRCLASTKVMSSGCSWPPIHVLRDCMTCSEMASRGRWRWRRTTSNSRSSPNSPNSFSGSVTPSL